MSFWLDRVGRLVYKQTLIPLLSRRPSLRALGQVRVSAEVASYATPISPPLHNTLKRSERIPAVQLGWMWCYRTDVELFVEPIRDRQGGDSCLRSYSRISVGSRGWRT